MLERLLDRVEGDAARFTRRGGRETRDGVGGQILRLLLNSEQLIGGNHDFTNFSTYFAITSTAIVTASFTFRSPSVVSKSVVGMRDTENSPS